MLKKFNLIVLGFFLTVSASFAQDGSGIIKGVVVDESKGNAPIYGAIVVLKQNGNEKGKRKTQDKGQFRFDNLSAGKYEIIVGYATLGINIWVFRNRERTKEDKNQKI